MGMCLQSLAVTNINAEHIIFTSHAAHAFHVAANLISNCRRRYRWNMEFVHVRRTIPYFAVIYDIRMWNLEFTHRLFPFYREWNVESPIRLCRCAFAINENRIRNFQVRGILLRNIIVTCARLHGHVVNFF